MPVAQLIEELLQTKPGLTPFRPYVIGLKREVMPIIFEDPLIGAAANIFINDLGMAHDLVQSLEGDPIADYLHGIIHRREGDFWNANYWFRMAKPISEALNIDPEDLTNQVEREMEVSDEMHEMLMLEWRSLTQYILTNQST